MCFRKVIWAAGRSLVERERGWWLETCRFATTIVPQMRCDLSRKRCGQPGPPLPERQPHSPFPGLGSSWAAWGWKGLKPVLFLTLGIFSWDPVRIQFLGTWREFGSLPMTGSISPSSHVGPQTYLGAGLPVSRDWRHCRGCSNSEKTSPKEAQPSLHSLDMGGSQSPCRWSSRKGGLHTPPPIPPPSVDERKLSIWGGSWGRSLA